DSSEWDLLDARDASILDWEVLSSIRWAPTDDDTRSVAESLASNVSLCTAIGWPSLSHAAHSGELLDSPPAPAGDLVERNDAVVHPGSSGHVGLAMFTMLVSLAIRTMLPVKTHTPDPKVDILSPAFGVCWLPSVPGISYKDALMNGAGGLDTNKASEMARGPVPQPNRCCFVRLGQGQARNGYRRVPQAAMPAPSEDLDADQDWYLRKEHGSLLARYEFGSSSAPQRKKRIVESVGVNRGSE
ncbi:unnamed protein product, partial [Symbiodinium microadriaticum]